MSRPDPKTSTFVTRLTSSAPAAIAVLEIDGHDGYRLVRQCWRPATDRPLRLDEIRYGRWSGVSSPNGSSDIADTVRAVNDSNESEPQVVAAEDIVVCLTGDSKIELHCHGGRYAAERIIRDLTQLGAVERSCDELFLDADARRFMEREAVSPQSPSTPSTEAWSTRAWQDLLRATTPLTTALMLQQARGALVEAIKAIEQRMERDDLSEARASIDELLSRYEVGRHLIEPWKLAIVGPPNVGKSSLLNAILGFERAIVAPVAGTTRDVLNERTGLMGWAFEIVDTAGIRTSEDVVEAEGVRRAVEAIEKADLSLCLIDPLIGWDETHVRIAERFADKLLWVMTKADLDLPCPSLPLQTAVIQISAKCQWGLEDLYRTVVERLIPEDIRNHIAMSPESNIAVPYRAEHVEYLQLLKSQVLDRLARVS